MKHVFIINSHTTFMTAMGVIDLKKIDSLDVIMVYTRNYKNSVFDIKWPTFDLTKECEICNENIFKNKISRKTCIDIVDHFILQNIHNEFELYFPHLQLIMCQLFYTNSLCKRGSYLQEAGYSQPKKYITKFSLKDNIKNILANKILRRSSRVVRSVGWYQPNYLLKQDIIDTYALNNEFFKGIPSVNHLIKWPVSDKKFNLAAESVVFVFDGFVKNGLVEKDFYLEQCRVIIEKYSVSTNYIKFHPAQDDFERSTITTFFEQVSKTVILLDDSVPFEVILSSVPNLTVIGFSSSLLKFAVDLNHKVIANDNLLKKSACYITHIERSGFPYMCDLLDQNK